MSSRTAAASIGRRGLMVALVVSLVLVTVYAVPTWTAPAAAQDDEPPIAAAETHLVKAHTFTGDLRTLPYEKPEEMEFPELEEPEPEPIVLSNTLELTTDTLGPSRPSSQGPQATHGAAVLPPRALAGPWRIGSLTPKQLILQLFNVIPPAPLAPAPAPLMNFAGLDFATWGAGHPPDTNGDVGPNYYIQTINTSIGVFDKISGTLVAGFTFNTFMSQGNFGNLCDTNNFGDPVVLYDSFEDRWVITDFAFQVDGSGNVVNPPGAFECFAVSRSGDPLTGGWYFYSINTAGGLGDYPKLGIWPDGIYMSVNMFGYPAGSSFQNSRVYAFNKAQMYAGIANPQVVSFNAPAGDFTLLPANARLQTGTPPVGTPNYFVSTWQFVNAVNVYKFHVDWDRISLSTFTGPTSPNAATSWPNAAVPNAPSSGGNNLDVLQIRAMVQNQYSNLGGVESLWTTHTVRRANTTGFAAPRWYQIDVTGGTVAANLPQAATWDPDGANVMYRFMPSLAVDRAGDLALGYSTSNSTTKPALKYAGRLATDPINTFGQTEQELIQGAGTQVGNCGGSACTRWGDYSAMTLDPDGCTFWYTNEYYAVDGLNHQTRIGSFKYPACTPVGSGGTLQGTVTRTSDSTPLSGATVRFGSRTTTTNGSGFYQFVNIPAGTYSSLSVSFAGYGSSSASAIVISDNVTTTQDFALNANAASNCFIDTTEADFELGLATNCDLTGAPGDVTLVNAPILDQQNTTLGNSGVGITILTWGGQTFTPAATGQLVRVDINMFCSGCTGTTPALTLSLRATSGGLPTGADLASATITGFSSGSTAFYTANFASPPTLTAGTQYALLIRPTANPSVGTYALTRSGTSTAGADVYAGGTRVAGATSGTIWSIPLTGGVSTDAGFKIYLAAGYALSGTLVSGLKDANPASNTTPHWTNLAWTASTPASTSLKFQVAASNSSIGPFNFVGPDGTAATYFTTTGASLAQFNGSRYLKYTAYLTTTDSATTPILSDVTICFTNVPSYTLTTASAGSGTGSIGLNPTGGLYLSGTVVTLTATPSITATFAGWSGNLNSSVNPITITMDAAKFVTATFSLHLPATVMLSNLSQTYDSTPKPVTATTNPPGLSTVITYTGVSGTIYGPSATAPTNAGTYSVTVVVNDATYYGSASDTLIVLPATTALALTSAPNPSALGQSVTFTSTVSVVPPGAGTPTGIITLTIDGTPIAQALSASGIMTYSTSALALGVHPVSAAYSGDNNFTGSNQTLSGGQVVTNTSITELTAASSSPTRLTDATFFTATISGGTNVTYQWNFGDGTPLAVGSGVTTSHTYAAAGNYTAIVTATNGSSSASASTAVSVTNQAPIANAGTNQNVSVTALVTLDGSGSTDPDGHLPLAYRWQQTGGTSVVLSNVAISRPTFTAPSAPAVLTFTLIVTDAFGAGSTPASVTVRIADQAISGLSAINDSPTRIWGTTHLTATITAGSNVQYTWNFGDGQFGSGAQVSHSYANIGTYTATVTATNSLGALQATTLVNVTGSRVLLPLILNQTSSLAQPADMQLMVDALVNQLRALLLH